MRCFAVMRRMGIIALLFLPLIIPAQSFLEQQEEIFSTSEAQWLCKELETLNPSYFNCATSEASWTLPTEDSLSFFQNKITLSDSERTAYSSLFFPKGNCVRYLKLISLCDLYFPLIKRKARDAGLPEEYALMPVLLSGMNTAAKQGSNRSGLWAMDYLAARKYGLRIDEYVDERRGGDFTISAVMEYLSDLNSLCEGDAIKVMTAYRKGMPYMKSREGSAEPFYESIEEDDREFIKLFAYFRALLSSTRAENQLSNYFDVFGQYEGVFPPEDMRITAMVRILGVSESSLRAPNPVFVGELIEGSYRRIPFMLDNRIISKYDLLKDSIAHVVAAPVIVTPVVQDKYHTVKNGETLGGIAAKYKMSVSQLKKINSLRSDVIRPGQRLIVGEEKTTSAKPEKKTTPEPASTTASSTEKKVQPSTPSDEGKTIYTVKSGDSLWKIAQRYKGVSESDIKKWNNCSDKITPGQKLVIYLK